MLTLIDIIKKKKRRNEKGSVTVEMVLTIILWVLLILLPINLIMFGMQVSALNNTLDYGLDLASVRGGVTPDVIEDMKHSLTKAGYSPGQLVVTGTLVTKVDNPKAYYDPNDPATVGQFVKFGGTINMWVQYPVFGSFSHLMRRIGASGLADTFQMNLHGSIVSQYVP